MTSSPATAKNFLDEETSNLSDTLKSVAPVKYYHIDVLVI